MKHILDVGSGHHPLPQATHLVDKYPDDNSERRNQDIVMDGRPFFKNDIMNLPFDDNVFNFANATHVVEHASDPLLAVSEMIRVSKSGYIECPSLLAENFFFGSSNHKYVLLSSFGFIAFVHSTRNGRDVPYAIWKIIRAGDFLFNLCHTRLYWGKGKAIRLKFNMENTKSPLKKLHSFLTFTVGDVFQNIMNYIAIMFRGDVVIYEVMK